MCKSNCQNNCNKCPILPKPSAMSKVIGDLVKTVVMLHEDHQEELTNTLLHDVSLHANLDKIEHLLWVVRQQRKSV